MKTLGYIYQQFRLQPGRERYSLRIKRTHLALLFQNLRFEKGAEIGVRLGHYSETLCRSIPKLKLAAVDIWHGEAIYQTARSRVQPFKCQLLRMPSLEAAALFEPDSLDFVYIDANHEYEPFCDDLEAWAPKVRSGGIIAGHDYHNLRPETCQVMKAVDEYVSRNGITPLFIVAGEREPSWFWVKQ